MMELPGVTRGIENALDDYEVWSAELEALMDRHPVIEEARDRRERGELRKS